MAEPGDVVGLMCHADRQGVYDWIAAHGGTADSPETLGTKVRAARAVESWNSWRSPGPAARRPRPGTGASAPA